ncbi:MAG: RagB/SusD family nutrient uptake outer membrane protein [Nonlabens sp.]|uniref:RagB/SusD family nutrient uptake outer membrane protein n=1 Tax=Nonlabens sp. TaxID=1888209 RepID=UPI003EF6189D
MKYLIKLFMLLTVVTVIASCEDILEETPPTQLSEEQVFATESGVEAALNGMYQNFAEGAYHGSAMHGLIAPISGKFFSNQGASVDATSLNCLPNNTWLERMWPAQYTTINSANVIIQNIESSDLANRDTSLGQAYFIRAATYFDLVRWFGDVPLPLVPSTTATLNLPRTDKALVYAQIIEDFEQAKLLLPDAGEYLVDRPIKWAAYAYLGKVYMQMAGEDGGNPALWQNAYDETFPVYQKYTLTTTYAELFDENNENTSESIFEIQYGENGAVRNSDVVRFYTPKNSLFAPATATTFGRVRPNKEVYDQHINQYPTDPRLDATFVADSYVKTNGSTQTIYPTRTNGNDGFTVLRKYFDSNFNGTTSSRNFIKFRYADVLLMLAEIENELNGPANAYQYVNEVLLRARTTTAGVVAEPADFAGLTQDTFRTRILRERQYEMLGEGHEWFDTRRRGYTYFLEEVVNTHNNFTNLGNKDFTYPTDPKNMRLPIPSSEINGNQAIDQSEQNPGY